MRKILLPLFLIIFSGLIIFYQFPELPPNLSIDEVEFAKLTQSLKDAPYIPYSTLATGHTTLYFYLIGISFELFGITKFALRLPSALFGVMNSVLIYFIFLQVFNKKTHFYAFILSFIFLTQHWYFNFARFSFEATFLLFLELFSILSFILYKRKKALSYLFLSGIFAGLAFNSYTPGRIFFFLPLLFLLYENRNIRQVRSKIIKPFLAFLVPFILLVTPLTLYLIVNPDNRVNSLSYLNNTDYSSQEKFNELVENTKKISLMFNFAGDLIGRHNYPGKPALNPIIGSLFAIGFFVTIIKIRNYFNVFFILYFILSVIPSLLTYSVDNPHMLRTFTVLPSVVYFVGNGILTIFSFPFFQKKYWFYLMAFLIILSALYELRTYFIFQASIFENAFEMRGELKELIHK